MAKEIEPRDLTRPPGRHETAVRATGRSLQSSEGVGTRRQTPPEAAVGRVHLSGLAILPLNNQQTGFQWRSTSDLIEDRSPSRHDRWPGSFELGPRLLLAASLNLTNLWRLAVLHRTWVAYVIVMVVVGWPVYVLQVMLGQRSSAGSRLRPSFKGLSVYQLIASFYLTCYFLSLLTWTVQLVHINLVRESHSILINSTGDLSTDDDRSVFQQFSPSATIHFWLFLILAAAILVPVIGTRCATRFVKSFIFVSTTGILVTLLVALTVALVKRIDPSSVQSIRDARFADWWELSNPKIWYEATVQTSFNLLIASGTLPTVDYGPNNDKRVAKKAAIFWSINLVTAIVPAAAVWLSLDLSVVAEENQSAAIFLVSKIYATTSDWNIWIPIVLWILAAFNGTMVLVSSMWQVTFQNWPILEHWPRATCLTLSLLLWLANLPGTFSIGPSVIHLWNTASGTTVLNCLTFQLISSIWAFGIRGIFRSNMDRRINSQLSHLWPVVWTLVTLFVLSVRIWNWFHFHPSRTELDPTWQTVTEWSLILCPLSLLIVYSGRHMVHKRRSRFDPYALVNAGLGQNGRRQQEPLRRASIGLISLPHHRQYRHGWD